MPGGDLRRFAAPAAFLLAVTIAVVLVRSGMQSGHRAGKTAATAPVTTQRVAETTTVATTTSARGHAAAAKRYWTVQAGDSFGVISSKSGVPVATIEQLNPTVRSTSLYIGEKIRIR